MDNTGNTFNNLKGFGKATKKAKPTKRRRPGQKSGMLKGVRADHEMVVLAVVITTGRDEKTVIADARKVCTAEAKRLAKNAPTMAKLSRLNLKDEPQPAAESPAKSPSKGKKAGR